MTPLAYRARALGPLGTVDWAIPAGVSVVVGPNRVGKSTLLRLPELLRRVLWDGLNEAFKAVFEGLPQRNIGVPTSTPMTLGLATEQAVWEVELTVSAGRIVDFPNERLHADEQAVLWRRFGSEEIEGEGCRYLHASPLPSLALAIMKGMAVNHEDREPHSSRPRNDSEVLERARRYLPPNTPDPVVVAAVRMMPLVSRSLRNLAFRTYDYEISHLLRFGSLHSSGLELQSTGENVFPLLRNWRDKPDLEERYEFVLATMREIFPHLGRVGFEQAGQTVTMIVSDRRWPGDATIPIARESTGFITALLQLCAMTSCSRGGLVTLDEIETSLHPRAIRVLVEAARRWAAKHDLRIVLATQSETVLDQFRDEPSQVFVLESQQDTSPKALTELFTPEYLSQFSLGDLFAHLEFGGDSNEERAP